MIKYGYIKTLQYSICIHLYTFYPITYIVNTSPNPLEDCNIGNRVVRGMDWDPSNNSDYHYGVPGYGYITGCGNNMAKVKWIGNQRNSSYEYRVDKVGKYYELSPAPQGVYHMFH